MKSADAEAFGVYVHWPFCLSKCPYCDFNSHVRHAAIDEPRFLRAFEAEIAATAARAPGRTVTSIFFGGGTPSLMQPATTAAILDTIGKHWSVDPKAEVSLEANPTSVEATRFRGYRAAGVNRVSLGVQALDDAFVERAWPDAHRARGARRRRGRPREFRALLVRPDLCAPAPDAGAMGAPSSSAPLARPPSICRSTCSPSSRTRRSPRCTGPASSSRPTTTPRATLYDLTQEICASAGLPAYEVSNHARPGAECRHNLVYWRAHEYAGIGPGAHGRLDIDGRRHATMTEKRPEAWLMRVESLGHGIVTDDLLLPEERADEFLLMGLRLAEGIDPARYTALSGRTLDPGRIEMLAAQGFVERDRDGSLRVTPAGFPVLDAVVADLAA